MNDPGIPVQPPAMLRDPRRRSVLVLVLAIVILLGLGSRKYGDALPPWFAANAGDALWTVAVYLALAFAFPRCPPWKLGLFSLGISFAVETSQLFHPSWLDVLRRTLPGKLLLGSGFLPADFVRYTAGAVIATAFEMLVRRPPSGRAA